MSLEERIRSELHDTAERLALDPGEYRRAVEAGQRRRRQQIIATLSGMAAVAGLVVVTLALRPGGEVVVTPSSTTAPATTAPSPETTALPVTELGAAVVVAGPEGISWSALGQPGGEGGSLQSDPYYETISWVIGDGAGGLVFTHEVTPLPWEQGTLLWLPAEAAAPRPIASPGGAGLITPIGVEEGRVYYRLDSQGSSEIVGVDLDGQNQQVVVGATGQMIGASLADGVVAVALGGDCGGLDFYGVDGTALPDPAWVPDCLPASINDLALAGDYLYTLEDGAGGRLLRRTNFETGESVASAVDDGWQIDALDSNTVAVSGTSVVVGDFSGEEFQPGLTVNASNTFALVPELSILTTATLGSGLGELPCSPMDLPPPSSQGLPEPVEAKRQLIFELAAGCELAQLAEIVLDDGAEYTFGGGADPLASWVGSARHGFDVLSMTVRMLNADPAIEDSGVYAWPAVHATGSEEDWQALSGILSAAEFEQYYQYRESGYLGLRIGIEPGGQLVYLIAGD